MRNFVHVWKIDVANFLSRNKKNVIIEPQTIVVQSNLVGGFLICLHAVALSKKASKSLVMKILYPNILPLAGGVLGLAMGLSYYFTIMISAFFIGRPSSTWILGILWLPFFLIKPVLIGIFIGSIAWLLIRPFHVPRRLALYEIKTFKIVLVLLMILAAVAGIIKITIGE